MGFINDRSSDDHTSKNVKMYLIVEDWTKSNSGNV